MKREDFNDHFTNFIKTIMKRAIILFEDEAIANKLLQKSYITGLKQLSSYNDNEDFKVWFANIMGKQYRQNIKRWKAEKETIMKTILENKKTEKPVKIKKENYYLTKQREINLYRFQESIPEQYRHLTKEKNKNKTER